MLCVGMDVHKDTTTIHVFDPAAEPKGQHRSMRIATTGKDLQAALRPLEGRCRICFEVGTQAQWVASVVRPLAAEVQVANASRIPWLFRDGRKNDRIDAKKLAILLSMKQVPTVHLPSADVSAWRALIQHRRSLVGRQTMTKNRIRAILRSFALRCPQRSLWTRKGLIWLDSLEFDEARMLMMTMLRSDLEMIGSQIKQVETRLDAIAASHPNVGLLRTIPGIGARTAEAVVAFADEIERFAHGKQFASYFGMTPTLDASGRIERHGHISKRGPGVVRWVLIEAMHRAIIRCAALQAHFDRIRRGKKDRYKKAIVASGRKMLTIMFAMMRDQQPFDPARVCRSAA